MFGIGTYYNQTVEKKNKQNELNVFKNKPNITQNTQTTQTTQNKQEKTTKILPSTFSELLNKNTKKKYKKRKHNETKLPNTNPEEELIDYEDSEILKYTPKKNNVIKSKLTGEEFSVESFITSNTISKDDKSNSFNKTWAVPFTKKATQPMNSESFQNKLELFTGNQEENHHKKETKPFFKATQNLGNVDGSPNTLGQQKTRFVSSRNYDKQKPFEQERVGPGVGQNYGNKGKGGFHQYELQEIVRPKNIDELRTICNPKVTYKSRVVSGKGIDKGTKLPNQAKRRPEQIRIITSKDEMIGGKAATTKAKMEGKKNILVKLTNRRHSKFQHGHAGPAEHTNQKITNIKYQKPHKNIYGIKGPRNLTKTGGWDALETDDTGEPFVGDNRIDTNSNTNKTGLKRIADYGKSSVNLPPNERDTTQKQSVISNIASIFKSIIAPIQDKIKRTKKENIEGNPNKIGYISANLPNKMTVYDPNDIAKTTIKETNIHNDRKGNITGPNKLTTYDPDDTPKTTIKETNIHNDREGNIAGPNKLTTYDPNDIARTTIKETTIHNTKEGVIKGPTKLTTYDPNDIPKTTIKETNIHNNREGNIDVERMKKPQNYNILPPKRTLKETTIDNIHHTNVSFSRGDGKGYLSSNYYAPATIKQFTSDVEYNGNISSSQGNKGGYLSNEYYAPTTMKQFTSDNEYTGSANSSFKSPTSYKNMYNAHTNSNREKISRGRAPTNNGVKVVNGANTINTIFKKQNSTINYQKTQNVSVMSPNITSSRSQFLSTQRVPLSNKGEIERINPSTLNQLNNNPYHFSINRNMINEIEGFVSEISGDEDSEGASSNEDIDMENFISEISEISDNESF